MKQKYVGSRMKDKIEIENIGGEDDEELESIAALCSKNEKQTHQAIRKKEQKL